ncbi:DUF3131 domain-containing protein [Paenibacillus sp. IB182496]|uniref:DUF3131 domain-containing protein n=1 Tax=Paenibacillus sabuli TaxID=2772509 RepID=A0A927BQN4_9BACL|nr:glucoamylase family protein [Paenibacillus sabuli]MBD2844963.1 DUF3131 domain-containing protein [Paenibacillus sabuli]
MILNQEQLKEEARKLALTHDPYMRRRPSTRLWRAIEADIDELRAFVEELRSESVPCTQPAEEWLLDHSEFLEEQALIVLDPDTRRALKALPQLRGSGEARVLALCGHFLKENDGTLDEEMLQALLGAYQEVSLLTLAEAWAVPQVLRLAIIRQLAEAMRLLRERRDICRRVERALTAAKPAELAPEAMEWMLAEAGLELPLSGPVVVHLIKHLREWSGESAAVREWLKNKLENGQDSLDKIITYEYQLQADYQVRTGNLIGSLRKLSRLSWLEAFERISLVERTLRRERTGDYAKLDLASRNTLRARVERLSRRLRVPESLVARAAVELADQAGEETAARLGAAQPASLGAPAGAADRSGAETGSAAHPGADEQTAHTPGSAAQAVQASGVPTSGAPSAQVSAVARQSDQEAVLPPRRAFFAYYLLEGDGLRALQRKLRAYSHPRALPESVVKRRAGSMYARLLAVLSAAALVLLALLVGSGGGLGWPQWIGIGALLLLPALEWAVTGAHLLIRGVTTPQPLLRYDFSAAVPPEATTLVVVPVIWSTAREVQELTERLELHYLATRDPQVHFALLGDYADADHARMTSDEVLMDEARLGIERLNARYPGRPFHLLQRRREWNEAEGVWMGWERKRGKLVELAELLQGGSATTFETIVGERSLYPQVRYVLTLDADTALPLGSAQRMIGTIHLPYNRPRLNAAGTRVVEGYGVLQPRIGMSYESVMRSRLAWLVSSAPGIDPYAFAVSDPYQDGLGEGIFTGKGIFEATSFHRVLGERIPDNRVLSHDLLEGGFLRAGLLSDIELIDGQPATFYATQQRQHRWVRGDWQLLPWLLPAVRDRRGQRSAVDLSALTRWQIVDNLRRSLMAPLYAALLLLAYAGLPGRPGLWLAAVLATLGLPVLLQLLHPRGWRQQAKGLRTAAGQTAVTLAALPYQTFMLLDAIGRTLYRLLVSRRHLLEWVSSAEQERRQQSGAKPVFWGLAGGWLFIAAFVIAVAASGAAPGEFAAGLALAALWAAAPLLVRALERPVAAASTPAEDGPLHGLAREIWAFFDDFVTAREHWLPPDNVQFDPPVGIAHRTSPTNIGLYLTAVVAARDFDFIDTTAMIERLERTLDTLDRLDKWEGHLYNWYDTTTLRPLQPIYVSTVDSGNLVGALVAAKEGVAEWIGRDLNAPLRPQGGPYTQEELNVAFAEELAPDRGALAGASAPAERRGGAGWDKRGQRLVQRMERLIEATDFRPLYDADAKLLALGYHVQRHERDQVLYDLMASEARQASFVAIALGQVSVSHWNVLGRTMTRAAGRPALLSWSGTMFEYLMPSLLMRTYRSSVWDSTNRAVVERQLEYARQCGVPLGVSESGYYAFDHQMNYQYQAFGVPGLGFKRGLERDLVVSPYATILALPYARRAAEQALEELQRLGARGKYGFYEAVDYTPERLPGSQRYAVVQSFMAHHQGMSLLTLANLLGGDVMIERFHRDKRVRAAELLLQERLPERPKLIRHPAMTRTHGIPARPEHADGARTFIGGVPRLPEVALLSGGSLTAGVTATGGGFLRLGTASVTRWRADAATEAWGSCLYIRDVSADAVWSPTPYPCGAASAELEVRFTQDQAVFTDRREATETELAVVVSPEASAEVRRLTLTNTSGVAKIYEVTTYVEPALAEAMADDAHPAFSKLFIKTSYDEQAQCLLAHRRPRQSGDEVMSAAHALLLPEDPGAALEFETDRAAFIGRGRTLAEPQALRAPLQGRTGSVADPALVVRRRFSIEPGQRAVLYAVTAASYDVAEPAAIIRRLSGAAALGRVFELAWNRGQIELRHLGVTARDAAMFQTLGAQVLYAPPLSEARIEAIRRNTLGQSALWPHGLSGDRPIVLVRVAGRGGLPLVAKLLVGHEYLRRMGVPFDLVLLNESREGYQQAMQETLQRAVDHEVDRYGAAPEGVRVLAAQALSEEERTLLTAVACLVLRAGASSLRAQLRWHGTDNTSLPEPLGPSRQPSPPRAPGTTEATEATRAAAVAESETTDASEALETPNAARAAEPAAHRPAMSSPAAPAAAPNQADEARAARPESAAAPRSAAEELLYDNGWGGFTRDGRAYRMTIEHGRELPAPWSNVMANPAFGTLVTELGTGYTWWRNSRECKLTSWSNDPVLDPPSEKCYLRDERDGVVWDTAATSGAGEAVQVTHGRGYSGFVRDYAGIRSEQTVFVPWRDPVKLVRLKLTNTGRTRRELSVTYYAEWVLGVSRYGNGPLIETDWDGQAGLLLAVNRYQETFREAHAFLGIFADAEEGAGAARSSASATERTEPGGTASETPVGASAASSNSSPDSSDSSEHAELTWTGDRVEFIGRGGTVHRPAALQRTALSGRTGVYGDACGAVQRRIVLEPGETRTVNILLGCAADRAQAAELAGRYRSAAAAQAALAEVRAEWEALLGQVVVETPAKEMDLLMNGWLLYQSLACRMWARTAFYQAGGAYGYRDQLQDAQSMLHAYPELTRRQILLHAAHQYVEGDVQHWWHEETARGIRTQFSDDLLWLPYTVSRYVEHTGDAGVLDESAPYLTSAPLAAGEHERYEATVQADERGTVYAHCLRAIDLALSRIGEHGLPLIGIGDWNDGMNHVGSEGRGESVWLGWFLSDVLTRFEPICRAQGESERAARYEAARGALAEALDAHGWDGHWYRRAFTDAGDWLGTMAGEECRIDAIAQSWSVLSGAGAPDKTMRAMEAFDRELVDRELSIARLLTPPFEHSEPSPGYIQGYPPGIRENGAQYTHGVLWGIAAWAKLGRGDKAFELLRLLSPITHTRTPGEVRRYVGEPYVMAADVYTAPPHKGHAGWTWYTGAAGWMYQVGLESVLGIRRRGDRLLVQPCIPADWPGYTVTYRYGRTRYRIEAANGSGTGVGVSRILLDGRELPAAEPDLHVHSAAPIAAIPLVDDGGAHIVELTI